MYGFSRSSSLIRISPRLVSMSLAGAVLLSACGGGGGASAGSEVGGITDPANNSGEALVTLRWAPSEGHVSGYQVLSGPDPETVSNQVADISITAGSTQALDPYAVISPERDLGLHSLLDQQVCFSVRAYNDYGFSPSSNPVCTES